MRQKVFVLLCIIIHVLMSSVWADSWNVELVGRETSGGASAVHVAGNYAYVTDMSGGLRVIYISDPSNPYEVGFCDIPGYYARGVYVSCGYAYVVGYVEDIYVKTGEVVELPVRVQVDAYNLKDRSTEIGFTLQADGFDELVVTEDARFLGPTYR